MEVLSVVSDLVANLGFPIFCVIFMFRELDKERTAHEAESKSWVDALNNNTLVMQKIITLLEERT